MCDASVMRTTARTLKIQMIEAGLLSSSETSERVDALVAKLDVEGFLGLRELPAFWEMLSFWHIATDIAPSSYCEEPEEDKQQDVLNHQPVAAEHTALKIEFSAVDSTTLLPHPQTLIGDVLLGGRFDKLIARLCRSASRSSESTVTIERLEDILNLPVESLLRLEGVGKAYRDDWQELKVLYIQATDFLPVPRVFSGEAKPLELVRDDMRLNVTQLSPAELKVIAKLERLVGRLDIRGILSFDSLKQKEKGSLGSRTRSQLLQLQERLFSELQLISEGNLNYHATPTSLITSTPKSFTSVAALGRFLLDRVDNFLATLDEKSQLIFQHRWGFVDKRLTLSEIGEKYNVSRERIRQLESKINERLNDYLALNSSDIWCAAKTLSQFSLRKEFEDLYECFAEQSHFHEFLEFVSNGCLEYKASLPPPPLSILDGYFALNGVTVDQNAVLHYLQEEQGGDVEEASNALQFLHAQGQVEIESGLVRPLGLGKHEAAAAVLAEHPNGLPWLDIARHANRLGIPRSPFSEQVSGHGLQDSKLMYVAGKGVYRHTRFADFSTLDESVIFNAIHTYLVSAERDVSNLSEIYASSRELRKYDYYMLRYVVKMRGEDSGIYFNGKSQTDSVSLNPEFDLYSQKSLVLQSMRQRQGPLTSNEVAELLKSRSSRHAKLYLNELMIANQVVQVDRMLYTTTEQAYEKIDLEAMRNAIETILLKYDKPVEPSIIQCELNILQGEAYSKYFYNSLARYFAQLGYWQRRHSLFALRPIPFASLTDAIDRLCKTEDSAEQNFASLRQHIAINEEAAKTSIYNWKAAKARLAAGAGVPELEDELENELEID